jgi:Subtilase family
MTNHEAMMLNLDPGESTDTMPEIGSITGAINTPSRDEILQRLRDRSVEEFKQSALHRESMQKRAAQLGLPLAIPSANGGGATLTDIAPDGEPAYVAPCNIAAADTIGVDELWPAGSVTAITPWPTGSTGLNLDGSGITIGMWEASEINPITLAPSASVQDTHDQFGGRVQQLDDSPTGISTHATSVAGSLAASGADAGVNTPLGVFNIGNHSRGSAYAANVDAYDLADIAGEFDVEASVGLNFSNHSYGRLCGWQNTGTTSVPSWVWYGLQTSITEDWKFGAYSGVNSGLAPRELDGRSVAAPYTLMTYAAGNDQNEGPGGAVTYTYPGNATPQSTVRDWNDGDASGYDSLPTDGCAKNVLTVGAVNDIPGGYSGTSSVVLAGFSTYGPTDDGRIKPEVVACGIRNPGGSRNPLGLPGVTTTGWNPAVPSATNSYNVQQGTSYAAPSVTGAISLVLQRRNQVRPLWFTAGVLDFPVRSSSWRALAVHTASEAGTTAGPDYKFGYGLVNAVGMVNLVASDATSGVNPSALGPKPYFKEVLLKDAKFIQFKARALSSSTPLKVTLAWTDPAGLAVLNNTLDNSSTRLIQDLDVRVYPPGTTVFDPTSAIAVKPWVLNPDFVGKSAAVRGAAATRADDTRNNLEQVVIDSPVTTGDYIVRVTHKGTLVGGSQWASVMISGNTIPPVDSRITSFIQQPNGSFILTWNAVVGEMSKIQTGSLVTPWVDSTGFISANLESMSELVVPNGPSQFYRVARWY